MSDRFPVLDAIVAIVAGCCQRRIIQRNDGLDFAGRHGVVGRLLDSNPPTVSIGAPASCSNLTGDVDQVVLDTPLFEQNADRIYAVALGDRAEVQLGGGKLLMYRRWRGAKIKGLKGRQR